MEDRAATAVIGDATLVAVFDGHGGSAVADRAARRVIDVVTTTRARNLDDDLFWRSVFADLDLDLPEVGSTATLLLVHEAHIAAAWVGDSRAVLVTAGGCRVLTRDHRIGRADELARCLAAGAALMPPYVIDPLTESGLMCTRSLGDRALRRIGVIPEPEIACAPRTPEDVGFVAATDGLWDIVDNEEAAAICRSEPAPAAADRLVETVVRRGGADNVTVVVGRF